MDIETRKKGSRFAACAAVDLFPYFFALSDLTFFALCSCLSIINIWIDF